MNTSKLIGSILIIIGTMIGAGMLALPIVSAEAGFATAAIMLVAMWAVMTITGLLTLEVNLAFEEYANSLGTMAFRTLGVSGLVVSWLCTLLLLYALTAAYISGGTSLLANIAELILHVNPPNWFNALLFLVVMGGIVFLSTKSVDYCNRFLMGFKGLSLAIAFILLFPQVNFVNMMRESCGIKSLLPMLPIFLCSFGFHPTIPSLSIYIGRKPRELKFAIIYGSIAALVIYSLWLFVTMGTVPLMGEHSFASAGQSVGELIKTIYVIANNKWITVGINVFSNVAMTTSFLGVTLGLFDFLADGFKRSNTRFGRFQTSLLTFIPPLIFALFFPDSFVLALKYAAFFATILVVILPALMAYKLRSNAGLSSPYRVFGGKYLLFFIMAIGVLMLLVEIFALFV
ncbi:MAG: aromatic amino acid transport family protein [bacterium]